MSVQPQNRNKFKDNLSSGQREALKDMQWWNRDPNNPRVFSYKSEMLEHLQDEATFRETDRNPNELVSEQVGRWIDR